MKVMYDEDEWYPVYELITDKRFTYYPDCEIEVPDDLVERVAIARREFRECQRLLREIIGDDS